MADTGTDAVDLEEHLAAAGDRVGVIWALQRSDELNVNLVRFGSGGGVGEHANDEVDVLLVGVSGYGLVVVDGDEQRLGPGKLVFIPKGSRRSTRSLSGSFAYLTVHRRRGPLRIEH